MLKNNLVKTISQKIWVLLLLLVHSVNVLGADLKVNLDKTDVKWGEVFTLDIEARNPMNKTVQGGITVSFSSNLIITDKDRASKIYYEGSRVMKKGHISRVPTKDIMVENWYKRWPAHAKRTMRLKLFVLKTGTLKVYARAAFMKSIKRKQVVNLPRDAAVSDQQDYPVYVRHVLVKESPDFLRNFQLIVNNSALIDSPAILQNIQRLINNPRDKSALRFFGIEDVKDSPDYLMQLKKLFKNPKIVNSPHFLPYLKRLINNPSDEEALNFFGVAPADVVSAKREKPVKSEEAKRDAVDFISNQRGGENLVALIEAEGDIYFFVPRNRSTIKIGYYDNYYDFDKNGDIVSEIAKTIVRLKPDSDYVDQPDPMTGTSYRQLIR
jgi:hypothetical protein